MSTTRRPPFVRRIAMLIVPTMARNTARPMYQYFCAPLLNAMRIWVGRGSETFRVSNSVVIVGSTKNTAPKPTAIERPMTTEGYAATAVLIRWISSHVALDVVRQVVEDPVEGIRRPRPRARC